MQCWSATGYCWCVDEYGNVIEGTQMRGRPSCPRGTRAAGIGHVGSRAFMCACVVADENQRLFVCSVDFRFSSPSHDGCTNDDAEDPQRRWWEPQTFVASDWTSVFQQTANICCFSSLQMSKTKVTQQKMFLSKNEKSGNIARTLTRI